MPRASTQIARSALRRLPTRPSRLVQAVVSRLLPLLFRSQGLDINSGKAAEGLARALAAQQTGACNLLIAFRHPSTRDPVVLADLFWNRVPRAARRLNLRVKRPIQLRFLYDRGIPIWAGPLIGWLLQRSGGQRWLLFTALTRRSAPDARMKVVVEGVLQAADRGQIGTGLI